MTEISAHLDVKCLDQVFDEGICNQMKWRIPLGVDGRGVAVLRWLVRPARSILNYYPRRITKDWIRDRRSLVGSHRAP